MKLEVKQMNEHTFTCLQDVHGRWFIAQWSEKSGRFIDTVMGNIITHWIDDSEKEFENWDDANDYIRMMEK